MAILKVARIGHPVVRAAAREVRPEELRDPMLQRLIDDMAETMHEYEGVGVAAPQVHVGLRLAVVEVPARRDAEESGPEADAPAGVPLTVLVNPRVTPLGDQTVEGWEGCLSVPGMRGVVPRFPHVRLEALDRQGRPYAVEAHDFFARVIQHECDHLDGRVYLDRMRDLRSLSFNEEFDRYVAAAHEDDDDDEGTEEE
jgi:peptide deformylase